MPPRKRAATQATNKVDETVVNQENPISSEKERESTDTPEQPAEVNSNIAPAMSVDETVENQMNPGVNMVDRQPDPVIVEDSAGIKYDVSKPYPELVGDSPETQAEKARIRQTEAVLNAKDVGDSEDTDSRDYVVLEFKESGLTAQGRVWKAGEVLRMEDSEENRRLNEDTKGDIWYEMSAEDQKKVYGSVKFERR